VRNLQWLAAGIVCCLAFYTCPVYACRYNVREVGFIDTGVDPYWLFVYSSDEATADETAGSAAVVEGALADTNIRFEFVNTRTDANHPAMEFVSSHSISGFPAAVLVSPDGPSRPLPLPENAQSLGEAVVSVLEDVLHSPARRQILERAASSYGVVLLIEGPEQGANATARETLMTAIGHIEEQLEFLPKAIAKPPEMVVLDRTSLAGEEILLWSLGLTAEDVNEPHAAVFYGRGRWIGPLFKGDILSPDHLTELLYVIGADCECGLDHRWLQGTMLPARWDEGLQQEVVESLGFDPENPMIKMEMVSIIRRGMGGFDYPGVPFGYQEIQVGGETPEAYVEPNIPTPEEELAPIIPQAEAGPTDIAMEQGKTGIGILAASLGGLTVLVAVASAVILLRARKA
jgi:hypothetical protein